MFYWKNTKKSSKKGKERKKMSFTNAISKIMHKPVSKKRKNEFSELASLLVQKEMRAKEAEATAQEVLEEYSNLTLAKRYSELSETIVYLENRVIDLEYALERTINALEKCCKKKNKKMDKLYKKLHSSI